GQAARLRRADGRTRAWSAWRAGVLAQSGLRPLRHDRSRASISAGWPYLAVLYPHDLYPRAAANRPRDGLPQSGRHMDGRRVAFKITLNNFLTSAAVSSPEA